MQGMWAMRGFFVASCFAFSLMAGTACSAATIVPIKGDLSINQGQGFQKVAGLVQANPGDLVMVSPDGSAKVTYPDGCKVNLQPGVVMTITDLSPCASKSYAQQGGGNPYLPLAFGAGVLGVGGFVGYEAYHSTSTTSPASP